ncbi:MAG: hypothetical protein CL917_09175 [Deltaproteobacteria bacterium]|nr:hypothetical protein [Deltaproteobacteria bacterium]
MQNDPSVYVPLTLLAAFGFAAAAVLQQAEAARSEESESASGALIWRLLKQPKWVLGLVAYIAAYGLQVWAVSLGPVVVIQPLIAAQLVFSLLLGTMFMGRRAGAREWLGAVGVTVGLGGFIVGTNPSAGNPDASTWGWILATTATALGTAVFWIVGSRTQGAVKSSLYGVASGLLWGFMIVLMKVVTHRMGEGAGVEGMLSMFVEPYFYGLLVTAIGGFLLLQKAFAAGSLTHALVSYTVVEIVLAVVLGILLFGEQPKTGALSLVVTGFSSILMFAGIVSLAGASADSKPAS